jgi:PEP-CTERM motif
MIPIRTRRVIRWLTAVGVFLAMSATAPAFFFRGWPEDGRVNEESLLKPGTPDVEGRPPTNEGEPNSGGDTSLPGGGGPVRPNVPEPGTVVLAAVGIVAVAIVRSRKRNRPHDSALVAVAR